MSASRIAELERDEREIRVRLSPDSPEIVISRDDLVTQLTTRIKELERERDEWKEAATAHHPNPVDFRYWEGRYLGEKARADTLAQKPDRIGELEGERDEALRRAAEWRLTAIGAEARADTLAARLKEAVEGLEFYKSGFKRTVKRTKLGVAVEEWKPTEELLDDCGNIAVATIARITQEGEDG